MTDIEQKALALLNEVLSERVSWQMTGSRADASSIEALCRAIERHEAFKQEVSDEVEEWVDHYRQEAWGGFDRFIIIEPKPDPLAEMLEKDFGGYMPDADDFRAALEARGLEIREKNND